MSDKNKRFLKQHLYLGFSDYVGPLLSLATYSEIEMWPIIYTCICTWCWTKLYR